MNVNAGYDAKTGYDSIKTATPTERKEYGTYHLRNFNNGVKAYLISKYCPQFSNVLDLASGKGGDLSKLVFKDISTVVLADISPESVAESWRKIQFNRTHRNKFRNCKTYYMIGDTFSYPLRSLPDDLYFHFSSCQMALHYSFKSEEMARQAISNLTERLVPGGLCAITTINAPKLVQLFKTNPKNRIIRNNLYYVERHFELNELKPFGCGYQFYLTGSVPGIDEYLVHPQVLIDLFKDYGCNLIEFSPFQEFHQNLITNPKPWTDPFTRKVVDPRSLFLDILSKATKDLSSANMTNEEWDIIGLYSFFVFKKEGELKRPDNRDQRLQPNEKIIKYIDAETGEICERDPPPPPPKN